MDGLSKRWQIIYGAMIGIALIACAGATFPFKHYGMNVPQECYDQGTLLGPKPEQDLSLKVCQPDERDKFKCVHLLTAEYQKLKKSHLDLQAKLAQCQREKAAMR